MRNWRPHGNDAGRNGRRSIYPSPQIPLATDHEREQKQSVHPEDRALLGSNPSAAMDSNTAGRSEGATFALACLPAGSTTMR